jgi:hypothetical protein
MAGLGLLDPSSVFASATAAPRPIPGGLSLQNGFVPSALGLSPTPVPPVPSHVSFDVRWPGHGERQKIRDETFGFTGAYMTSATTISFTAFNDHSDVIYKSDRKGQYNPTVEQGGAGRSATARSRHPLNQSSTRYPSTFPGGPPRAAISAEKLLPEALAMLSSSSVGLHCPATFA